MNQLYLVYTRVTAQVNCLQAFRLFYSDKKLFYHMVSQSCGLQIDMDQVSIPADELRDAIDDLSLLIR